MKRSPFVVVFLCILFLTPISVQAEAGFEVDRIQTDQGMLEITFVGHGTLMFTVGGKVIHVDPVSREADYAKMPKADLILITHEHRDHLDPQAIGLVRTEKTSIVLTEACARSEERR